MSSSCHLLFLRMQAPPAQVMLGKKGDALPDDHLLDADSDASDDVAVAELEMSMAGGLKALHKRRERQNVRRRLGRCARAQAKKIRVPVVERSLGGRAAVVAMAARGDNAPRCYVDDSGSYIRLSTNPDGTHDMRAVCMRHSTGQGADECNISRSCRCKTGKKGRPLGFMAWFLACADDPGVTDKVRPLTKKHTYIHTYIHAYMHKHAGKPQSSGENSDEGRAICCEAELEAEVC